MSTFSDKPIFNLKQIISVIMGTATIVFGIARFEYKTNAINDKLDTLIAEKEKTETKLNKFEILLAKNTEDIKAVTTSLTAIIRPDDITISKKR